MHVIYSVWQMTNSDAKESSFFIYISFLWRSSKHTSSYWNRVYSGQKTCKFPTVNRSSHYNIRCWITHIKSRWLCRRCPCWLLLVANNSTITSQYSKCRSINGLHLIRSSGRRKANVGILGVILLNIMAYIIIISTFLTSHSTMYNLKPIYSFDTKIFSTEKILYVWSVIWHANSFVRSSQDWKTLPRSTHMFNKAYSNQIVDKWLNSSEKRANKKKK